MADRIPVGILGATGVVGQRLIQALERHPWFEVVWLAASERSAGQKYGEAAKWRLKSAMPARVAALTVSPAEPAGAPKVVFASLDGSVARELEPRFAEAGCAVISNSSAFRMQPDVPLMIPEVNPGHLSLIEHQAWRKKSGGFMVTNSNCTAMGLVLALAPLQQSIGIERVFMVSMQAVSGAGYPGVPSLDILGNVIPYIAQEEEKVEAETPKLLGTVNGGLSLPADFAISVHCNRVAVEDGHMESVSVKLKKAVTAQEIIAMWRGFRGPEEVQKLPSAPPEPIHYDPAPDRPQPRFDAERGAGMCVSVGRLRTCKVFDWRFTVLSHNTIRGAAGAALLNAEWLKVKGYLG